MSVFDLQKIEKYIPFIITMSLEQFHSYRPPSSRKILHALSVDLEWNVVDAYDLMEHVCHIITVLEKNKRYYELYDFLEKKETYLELRKELEELMDKHHFRKDIGRYAFLDDTDEPYVTKRCYIFIII